MESHPTSSTDVAQGCALACVSCVCSRRTGPKDRQGELDGERERESEIAEGRLFLGLLLLVLLLYYLKAVYEQHSGAKSKTESAVSTFEKQ